MVNRINIICLGVKDINKSLDFFKELGFQTSAKHNAAIVFFNNKGTKLELYPVDLLAKDINKDNPPFVNQSGFSGITIACNMKSKQEVDELMTLVRKIGGSIVKRPQDLEWGGYGGYFRDLDGYYWEVAYGSLWEFDENEMLIID